MSVTETLPSHELRANSTLTAAQYRDPVLGHIFLAFAEHRFEALRPELEAKASPRRPVSADDFRARGVLFVPEIARLSYLVDLPEGEDLGANIDLAMDAIEDTNAGLRDVLPRGYQKLEKSTLVELVRLFAPLPRALGRRVRADLRVLPRELRDGRGSPRWRVLQGRRGPAAVVRPSLSRWASRPHPSAVQSSGCQRTDSRRSTCR